MKSILMVVAAVGVMASGMAYAQSGAEVAKAKGCLNCHDMAVKKMGPSIKDIAAKFKDDKGAEAKLTANLKEGKGHPKSAASDAELKAALQYMLTAK
ncbi:MAG: cytochrome C' [Burkholderiales bacterium]|nr:cytochrome C' [Burkholderiales bacterium]